MKYFLVHGQMDKAQPYIDALAERGWTRTGAWESARFALVDFVRGSHRGLLDKIAKKGIPIFIYPHAALGLYMWDGLLSTNVPIRCNFTFGEGQIQAMKTYGYPYPAEAVGWSYGQMNPFQSTETVRRILFAPKHPNGRRGLFEDDQKRNADTFLRLRSTGIPLTIYYGHDLQLNGLRQEEGVEYIQSDLTLKGAEEQISKADLVVAHDTFAYTSLALGKPTLMFCASQRPHVVGRQVASWEKYKHIMRYPLDVLDAEDTRALVKKAAASDEDIREWKTRMLGEPFNAGKFVDIIEAQLPPIGRQETKILMKSREELVEFWKDPTGTNRPENYLSAARNPRSEYLLQLLERKIHLSQDASILEVGCNAGRNLSMLYQRGYKNLAGIELNCEAVQLFHSRFPEMNIDLKVGTVEEHILNVRGKYDLIFTMAVLVHIHPSSDWIFQELAEKAQYLITIEDESSNGERHISRNYQTIFESLGMKQIFTQSNLPCFPRPYITRIFKV